MDAANESNEKCNCYSILWTPVSDRPLPETTRLSVVELELLYSILTQTRLDTSVVWRARPAPSLITRGEAEMLGLSDPRFARRVVLLDAGRNFLGFVNLRRLRRVANQVLHGGLLTQFHRTSSIADSVLRIPERFDNTDWHVLSLPDEILEHYGEQDLPWLTGKTFKTVPFVKHLRIVGGGLCAQVCCFMATMLAYRLVKHVVSIPEISFMARSAPTGALNLRGLNPREIASYFSHKHVGLAASIQFSDWSGEGIPTENDWKSLHTAIKAYLNARCPILAAVDMDRMSGRDVKYCKTPANNVYFSNELPVRLESRVLARPANRRHLVAIIGYQKDGSSLLFNDPAYAAFLKMRVSDLLCNACYLFPNETEDRKESFRFGELLDPGTVIPVTPPRVRLPLLDTKHYNSDRITYEQRRGLFFIGRAFEPENHFAQINCNAFPEPSDCHFWLLQLSDLRIFTTRTNEETFATGLGQTLESKATALIAEGWPPEQWVWLQLDHTFVFVWNAEADPEYWSKLEENYEDFLIAVAACYRGEVHWSPGGAKPPTQPAGMTSHAPLNDPSLDQQAPKHPLRVSVLTSFSSGGISEVKMCEIVHRHPIELYAFMMADRSTILGSMNIFAESFFMGVCRVFHSCRSFIEHFVGNFPVRIDFNQPRKIIRNQIPFEPLIRPSTNVCNWLAAKVDNRSFVRDAAAKIQKFTKDVGPCIAMATFFPGITSDDKNVKALFL